MTLPAASPPEWPSLRTIRVEATFNAKRKTVAIKIKFGNDEKSNGLCVCNATIRISNDNKIFTTKKVSRRKTGSGRTIIATSTSIPTGSTAPPNADFASSSSAALRVNSMTASGCPKTDDPKCQPRAHARVLP